MGPCRGVIRLLRERRFPGATVYNQVFGGSAMFRRALLGIASALLLPLSLQAQSESTSSPSPLEVTVKPTGQQKQFVSLFTHQSISVPELYFDIRNVSQKCVVGISLRTEDKDSKGKVMATGGATFFRQHEGKLSCLEPGQAFSESDRTNSLDESGNPSSKKDVTVDFVIFGDGSTWGSGNDLEQKGYLRGKFDAYKQMQIQKNKENCNSHANGSSSHEGPGLWRYRTCGFGRISLLRR
jgi:hypothetical protein